MPGYVEEVYNYIDSEDSTFKEKVSKEDFKTAVKERSYSDEIYGYMSGLDSSFKEQVDEEVFFESLSEEPKKPEDKEKIVSKYDVEDSDLFDEETINNRFDGYIGLLEDPKYTNSKITNDTQRLAELAKVKAEKEKFIGLLKVDGAQDKIKAAQLLKKIELSTIPSEETIALEIERNQEEYLKSKSDKREYIEKGAVSDYIIGLENDDINFLNLPTDENIISTQAKLSGGVQDVDLSDGGWGITKEEEEYLDSKGQKPTKRSINNLSVTVDEVKDSEKLLAKEEFQKMTTQLKNGAEASGLTVTTNLKDAEKSNGKLFYLPNLEDFEKDPNVILKIDRNTEVFAKAKEIVVKNTLVKEKLQSKEIRDEIDETLKTFEGKQGVGVLNDLANIVLSYNPITGPGVFVAENFFDLSIDKMAGLENSREDYKQNREDLGNLLELSKSGDDYKTFEILKNIETQNGKLIMGQASLSELKKRIENDPKATQADVEQYNNIRKDLINSQNQMQADIEYLGDMQFEGSNAQDIIDKTVKTYNFLEVHENILKNSGVRIVTGLGSLATELNTVNLLEHAGINLKNEDGSVNQRWVEWGNDVLGETGGKILEASINVEVAKDEIADKVLEKTFSYGEELLNRNRPAQRYDEIEGISQALRWGTEMLTGQILNTGMSIVIPGSGGLIMSALSESGNQMHDMKTRIEGEKWSEAEAKHINDFKKEFGFNPLGDDDVYKIQPEDINALQFYGTAAIYGIAEYASEKITLGNFKLGAKNLRKAFDLSKGVKKGMPITNKINQRWINLRDAGKDFAKGIPGESLGEGLVTVSQNAAEKYLLFNNDVSLLDGVTESMMSGLVMSGTMQSPGLVAQTYVAFRGPDANAKIAARGMDMLNISNEIKNIDTKILSLTLGTEAHSDLTSSKELLEVKLHELAQQQLDSQSETRKNIVSYTKADRQALINTYNSEVKIRAKIDAINDKKNIDPKVAERIINEQMQLLVVAEAAKNSIVGNAEWNADKTRARKFSNAYRAKNNLLGEVEMVVGNNNKEALQAGLDYVETRKDLTAEEKSQVKEQMKMTFNDAKKASRGDATVNGFAFGDNLTVETTLPDGTKSTKNIDVPMTFALNRSNTTVQSHEIGHHTLFKQFMENNSDAVGLVKDLESYVKKNYGKAYDVFLETKNLYGEYNSKGDISNPTLLAEENLARLSDFMRQNDLKADRTLHNKMFGRFQKFNDGSGQIKTGKDVFDMLTSFNESFETGELTGLTKTIAESTPAVSETSQAKKSMTKAEQNKVEDTLNDAPGQRNKDGKYTMTKAEWRADKNRAFSKAYNALMNGDLDGLIIAKMASGKDIFGQTREEFINDARDKIGQHMLNFDPQMQDSLFGWVNTYISRKVGDVANKAKREKAKTPGKKISTDQKIGEEGRTIAETIPGDTASDIEAAVDRSLNAKKKGIDNLRTRLGIEKGGKIYNKVVDSVKKVFGAKLPEVSNKNFKEALKKDFNTLLFKDIKNDIGTRAKYKEFIEGDVTFKDADGNTKKMPRWEMLYDYISQSTFNKRFESFIEPLINPETGKPLRPDNNPLFTKKKITKEQWVEYFLGDKVGASTKGTRKDALVSAIAQELAFDATMETINDPAIQARIKDIYETQGLRQAENYLEQVAKEIDREPGAKFSISVDVVKAKEILKFKDHLSSPEILESIQEGINLEGIINEYSDKLEESKKVALIKEINELRKIAKKFRDQQEAVLDNLDDIINENIDLSAKEKKAIIAEAKKKVKAAKKTIEISDAVESIAKELRIKRGFAYEQAVYNEINKAIKDFNIEGLKLSDGPTEAEGAADLVSLLFGQEFNVELKLENPRYSSVTLKYDLNNLAPSILKNYPFNDLLIKMANDKKEAFKKYRDRANELAREMFDDFVPMDQMGDALHQEIFDTLQREGLQKDLTSELMVSTDVVSRIYWAKNNGTAYIQIKGKGLYYLPNPDNPSLENPLGLKIPAFNGEVMISMAVAKNSIKSEKGPQKYLDAGIKLVDGKSPASAGFVSAGMRFQMTKLRGLPDSNINLDNAKSIKKLMDSSAVAVVKEQISAVSANNKTLDSSGVTVPSKFSKTKKTNEDLINEANTLDKALDVARDPKAPIKKIRVFDFDDTLATTKSDVLFTAPDGTNGKLNAEEFAKKGSELLEEGYTFDFSEFNKVTKGKPGPLLEVAKKIQAARGTEDVFVLTARAPQAQAAIKEFLDSVGLNIPIKNITGLGDSTGEAKAQWLVGKAAEGYNDFYFADDAMQNVDAVKKAMSVLDVKSKVQQAKVKFSKTVDQTINDIIEHKTGIKSESEYSDVKARLKGRKKGRFEMFIPPSAEDFVGLLYKMLGKGEIGNMQMDYFKEHLIDPYGRAMENLSRDQNRMINDFKALKEVLVKQGVIPKDLNKKAFGEYTIQDVARVLAWNKQGFDVPGISKTDLKQILDYAKKNPAIDVFAQNLIDINKGDGYSAPNSDWLGGTISTDLLDGLRTGKRSKYLQQWKENVDLIFSPKNLNKMEAAFGTKYREAIEDILGRMESGRNRSNKMGRLENRLLDYINNSVGTVMFFNMRSALLQTISAVNFIDFGSNNVFKAAKAFANQPQYWKDFMELMNSEFLVERRNGLKLNVSESEIADAAANSKNKAKAAVAYILQKGYLPTQFADSFAIASGGATFYRNRIDALMKEGMSEADAKIKAFQEFREIAEESQQSSRPDRVSQQQASVLGRLILAFQNTPMQMNRLGKKAFLDLKNRRKRPGMTQFQSDMSNASRVTYYFAVQSAIFSALQQALFALAFNDDEEESEKERYYNIANGMLNTFLNGTGMIGVAASTLISVGRKVYKESAKEGQFPGPNYEDAANEMLNFSPPIDIKLSKLRQAGLTWKYEGYKHDEANWGIDDPAYKSAAYVISGLTNVPLDRLISKSENVRSAIEDEQQTWKRVSLLLGWRDYQLNSTEERQEYVTSQKEAKSAYRKKQKESKSRQYSPKKPMTKEQVKEEKLEKQKIKYKKLNQAEQVRKLDSLGLTKKQIKSLKYEKDRVAKLIELMNK